MGDIRMALLTHAPILRGGRNWFNVNITLVATQDEREASQKKLFSANDFLAAHCNSVTFATTANILFTHFLAGGSIPTTWF